MKKYLISIFILILFWGVVWQLLYSYENQFPNKSIVAFTETIFKDLTDIEIVKSNEMNQFFDVCKNGNKLIRVCAIKNEDDWQVSLEDNYIEPIKIYVPKGAKVYIEDNYMEINKEEVYEGKDRYSILNDKNIFPTLECYTVSNYIDIPNIKVIYKEKDCKLIIKDREIDAVLDLSNSEKTELKEVLLNTAKLYARYITNDAKFSELSSFLYKDTEFYKEVRNFFNDWYAHDDYEFRDVEILGVNQVAENAFYGEVSFNYILKKGKKEFPFPSKYQIYFIKSSDFWEAICIDTK